MCGLSILKTIGYNFSKNIVIQRQRWNPHCSGLWNEMKSKYRLILEKPGCKWEKDSQIHICYPDVPLVLQTLMCSCPWASSFAWAGGISDSFCSALGPHCPQLRPSCLGGKHCYPFRALARTPEAITDTGTLAPGLLGPDFYLLRIYELDFHFSKHIATAYVWDLCISCRGYRNRLPIYFPQSCQSDLSKNAILSCQSSF